MQGDVVRRLSEVNGSTAIVSSRKIKHVPPVFIFQPPAELGNSGFYGQARSGFQVNRDCFILDICSNTCAFRYLTQVRHCTAFRTSYFMSSTGVRPMLRDVTNAMTDGPSIARKRVLFKKPTWAAKSTSVAEAKTDFFDHRDSTYSGILAEREKRREKQRAKAAAPVEAQQGREPKRRRLSEDEDGGLGTESSDGEEAIRARDSQREGPATRSMPTKKRRTASLSPDLQAKQYSRTQPSNAPNTRIVDLEDEELNAHTLTEPKKVSPIKPRPKPPSSDPESDDEDEYTLELKRKAREKVRLGKLGPDPSTSITPEPTTTRSHSAKLAGPSQSESAKFPAEAPLLDSRLPPSTSKGEDETIVMILIRTAVPNTKELIVNRKVSQNLQQVKEAWCKRQGFDATMTRKVFLTWRGNKLFNATTLTHILKTLKAERKRSGIGSLDSDEEDFDPSKGRIEVEAVTEDILTERKRLKETEDRLADTSNIDGEVQGEEAGESQPQKELDVQMMLNSPGLESVLLKVRPTTLVSKVMAGFKKIRQVEQGMTCWLIFDGERLDPETRIGDTEIEDGDAVDVQIR